MKTLTYENPETLLAWASKVMREDNVWSDDSRPIGVLDDGRLCGVIVYNDFTEAACSAHIATDGTRAWATRSTLAGIFAFPFIQLRKRRITAPIPASNTAAVVNAVKLGFRFEGRLLHSLPDDDQIILGMIREECPWLPRN